MKHLIFIFAFFSIAPAAIAGTPRTIEPTSALVIAPTGGAQRGGIHHDALEAIVASGEFEPPEAGDGVDVPGGPRRTWERIERQDDGWFAHRSLQGGWAFFKIDLDEPATYIMTGVGHAMAYVNEEPRAGDVYETGFVRLPVRFRAGENRILLRGARGRVKLRFEKPEKKFFICDFDTTLPDILEHTPAHHYAGIVVTNSTSERAIKLLMVKIAGTASWYVETAYMPPFSVSKIPVGFEAPDLPAGTANLVIRLINVTRANYVIDENIVPLQVVDSGEARRVTFISDIDRSTQYYALQPAIGDGPKALVLSLHGAGVEAIGQARAYSQKSWAHIVCPTNRRPFGFDHEDWGRLDDDEVLHHALNTLDTDRTRVYLTGHSMGGHGAWQLGVHYPLHFAAIAPSAGWVSFSSYTGAAEENEDPRAQMFADANSPSDTLRYVDNLKDKGIYILHGTADDNVPATEAQHMFDLLRGRNYDVRMHLQEGAGHWWDDSDEPGASCVDFPEIFDFFSRHRLPPADEIRHVDFTTATPSINEINGFVFLNAQEQSMKPSSVHIDADPHTAKFHGTTENVQSLILGTSAMLPDKREIKIEIDGTEVITEVSNYPDYIKLSKSDDGTFQVTDELPAVNKYPFRCGPFRDVFNNNVRLVYSSGGTEAENLWSMNKARYDAETFWYRGNGHFHIARDIDYNFDNHWTGNVVLYGNKDTNLAWDKLLGDCPVTVERGKITFGDEVYEGDDLGALFIYPMKENDFSSIGVVGGTGIKGMRITDRQNYFVSGCAYPDITIFSFDALRTGMDGVLLTGFFGYDWSIEKGRFARKSE
ncbi:MAG: prolyl oligopeptidase family serine peptidase [Planctomycetes bacterium]|nr:prolyl oligopeptidase family serine peptidase [Planctomycetota bacterium]